MAKFFRRYYSLPLAIDRTGVMDEVTKKDLRRLLAALVGYGILLLYLCLHVAITIVGYKLEQKSAEYRNLSNRHGQLLLELSRQARWKEMEKIARRDYGFVDSFQAREIALPAEEKRGRWWKFAFPFGGRDP